jgi:hypothetical protein
VKTLLLLLSVLCVRGFAAAPQSVAGTVFRSYYLFSGISNAGESTIVLGTDGRYTFLKTARGVIETPHADATVPDAHWAALLDPPEDGRYEYTKTGELTATLTLIPDRGSGEATQPLYFTSATTGSSSPAGLAGLGGSAFYLTELAARNAAPLANIALRGTVTPGRPLIMGFVIPSGTEREVLIRVVGPSLARLGVASAWSKSSLQLFRGSTALFGDTFRFPYWSEVPRGIYFNAVPSQETALRKIFEYVGAFALSPGSNDSAVVVRLAPGSYTATAVADAGDAGGEALIELYPLP